MNILLIDNYDSFTWNLHQLLQQAGAYAVRVVKNDEVTDEDVANADALVFSPGPGLPWEAGAMKNIIKRYSEKKKMLGVCLGHQAIGEVFGTKTVPADKIYHGEQTELQFVTDDILFVDIPSNALVGRYHSWVIDKATFPDTLEITAVDKEGVIMAMRHKTLDIRGVQFHPESIMTPAGLQMMKNWLK